MVKKIEFNCSVFILKQYSVYVYCFIDLPLLKQMKVVVGQLWKYNYKYVDFLRQKIVLLLLVSDYYNFQKFNINIYCKWHKIMTLTGCFFKGLCVLSKC